MDARRHRHPRAALELTVRHALLPAAARSVPPLAARLGGAQPAPYPPAAIATADPKPPASKLAAAAPPLATALPLPKSPGPATGAANCTSPP